MLDWSCTRLLAYLFAFFCWLASFFYGEEWKFAYIVNSVLIGVALRFSPLQGSTSKLHYIVLVLYNFFVLSFYRNMNMVDNMISMMEKYTDNLEELVAERTRQLEDEKLKTDQLLYSMLPR